MNTKKQALLLVGGWDGHEPELVSKRFAAFLEDEGFIVRVEHSFEVLQDREYLFSLDLFVPVWTMGDLPSDQVTNLVDAIGSGVGIAGCHGGMCDAFRNNVVWQFMTGGNWVAHPGGDGVSYRVHIKNNSSELTRGVGDFDVVSEQYYLHVDPVVEVLATTDFPTIDWYHSTNGFVTMPVVWTKRWGHGRVYYNSLGHHNDIFDIPEAWELMKRGLLWASEGKKLAKEQGLGIEMFATDRKMF